MHNWQELDRWLKERGLAMNRLRVLQVQQLKSLDDLCATCMSLPNKSEMLCQGTRQFFDSQASSLNAPQIYTLECEKAQERNRRLEIASRINKSWLSEELRVSLLKVEAYKRVPAERMPDGTVYVGGIELPSLAYAQAGGRFTESVLPIMVAMAYSGVRPRYVSGQGFFDEWRGYDNQLFEEIVSYPDWLFVDRLDYTQGYENLRIALMTALNERVVRGKSTLITLGPDPQGTTKGEQELFEYVLHAPAFPQAVLNKLASGKAVVY